MDSLDDDYNETETREFITDALKAKGWKLGFNMRYEYKITDGRVQIDEDEDSFRDEALFADYLLFAPNNQPLCVVEAKRANQIEGTGIQQAINYCNLLKAPFAASSNGKSFVFTDLIKGHEEEFPMEEFPTQSELWQKFVQDKQYTPEQIEIISKDYYHGTDGKEPRYYQRAVIDLVVEAKRANQIEGTGIQQAINYCNLLKAPFAASSNGKSFVFTDLIKGHEEEFSMEEFPTQSELWQKFVQDKQYTPEQIEIISKDYYHGTDGKEPRYYQRAVIDLVVEAYAKGRKRMM
nr:type I restriction enzyme HsdR N-terminal domain-containing protein [Treponema sp.]